MKNEASPEILFYRALIKLSVLVDSNRVEMEAAGIDLLSWPNCPEKIAYQQYINSGNLGKGSEIHKVMTVVDVGDLPEVFEHDLNQLSSRFELARDRQVGMLIMKQLASNPNSYEDAYRKFTPSKISKVNCFDVKTEIVESLKRKLIEAQQGKALVVVPGWERLSRAVGGFNEGRVSIMSAGSGVGKTNWALNFALCAADAFPVLYFNMEMMPDDILFRVAQSQGSFTAQSFYEGQVDFSKIEKMNQKILSKKSIYFTDGRSLERSQIISFASMAAKEKGIKFVFVDYDQKIISRKEDARNEEWFQMLKNIEAFEQLAMEEKIHVIVLGQADDVGELKSSKRAKQPVSTFLSLQSDDERINFYIKAIKNRFGRHGVEIPVNYQPEFSYISESTSQTVHKQPDSRNFKTRRMK